MLAKMVLVSVYTTVQKPDFVSILMLSDQFNHETFEDYSYVTLYNGRKHRRPKNHELVLPEEAMTVFRVLASTVKYRMTNK